VNPPDSNISTPDPALARESQGRVFDTENPQLGRRIAFIIAVIGISLITGMALVMVKTEVLVAAVIGVVTLVLILRNPYLGLLVYLVVYSMRLAEVFPALAILRPERILGVLTFGLLVLSQLYWQGRIAFDASRQTRHFYLLILAAFLSVPFAYWRIGAWMGTMDFVKFLMFYLLVVHLVNTRAKLRGFVYLQCAMIGYLALDSTLNYLRGALLHAQGIDRALGATSMADGPNELGATMACTIPLFVYFSFTKQLGRLRLVFMTGLALTIFTLMLTGSRSGLIGFMASMVFVWWKSRHRVILGAIGVILAIGMFAALPEQYKGRYATITTSSLDGSSQERLKVWTKGMEMFASRPITGVGIGCFGTANAAAFSGGARASWLESHSLYVQVPAEMGLVGIFAFFSFLLEFMRLNRRTERQMSKEKDNGWAFERALLTGMFGGFIALLFTGIFGHSLTRDTWYLYSALGLATLRIYISERPELAADLRERIMGLAQKG